MSTDRDISRKLAFVLLLWVCAFTLPWIIQASFYAALILGRYTLPPFRPSSERASTAFSRFIVYSVVVTSLVIALNAFLIKSGEVAATVLGISFHEEGILFGVRTASRLLLLSFSILLFFVSTPLPDLIRYLQEKGLQPSLVLVLLLTLHFLDQLPGRIHQIFLAQQARGAPVDSGMVSRTKALFSILSPLVLSSIVESIERGTALELRGFLQKPAYVRAPNRTSSRHDWLILSLISLAAAILVYKLVLWLTS